MEEAKNNGSLLPVTELVDKYYGEVQGMGGNRWDTSSLIKRFRKQTRMQPAYYENFEEIQNKYWSMLDDAITNRGSQFRIPVFICAHQDEVDGRIVVLRKSDRENNLLQFHTDFRSPKVDILKKNKNASLVFYDKEEKIQLRVKVKCEVNNQKAPPSFPPIDGMPY